MKISKIDLSLIKTQNKWIERIFANLLAIVVIDHTLYVKYIGKEENLSLFKDAYKKHFAEMIFLLKDYGISVIKSDKEVSEVKLNWLKELVENFNPKHIEFSIKN